MCSKREPFNALLPLLRHVVPLDDGNCRLTIPVVKGRCAREALPHAFNIGVFKYGKRNPTTIKHITTTLGTLMEVVTLLLTAIIGEIFHKQCQWLAWRVWWHALAFVTHEITWRRAYVAWLSPLPWKNWCHFAPKSTQSCYNVAYYLICRYHKHCSAAQNVCTSPLWIYCLQFQGWKSSIVGSVS